MIPDTPQVSILLAVRNEAESIGPCLDALCQLQAPPGFYEILIGDDASCDLTCQVIRSYLDKNPHLNLFCFQEKDKPRPGKAGILALLAQKAQGNYFYFTDADIQVNPQWLNSYQMFEINPRLGVLNGCTLIQSNKPFHHWQALEWIFEISCLKILAKGGIPLTSWGNNMAVRRRAYEQTGGYTALPFSLTEDFQLFWAILKQGYTFHILDTPASQVMSKPCPDWKSLIAQRQRWLKAIPQLPLELRVLVYGRLIWFPLLALVFVVWHQVGWFLLVLGILAPLGIISLNKAPLGTGKFLEYFFGYLLYSLILNIALLVRILQNRPVSWKGRVYD